MAGARRHVVALEGFAFVPDSLTVRPGDAVTFKHTGAAGEEHVVLIDGLGAELELAGAGAEATHVFRTQGCFEAVDSLYSFMACVVKVEEPAAAAPRRATAVRTAAAAAAAPKAAPEPSEREALKRMQDEAFVYAASAAQDEVLTRRLDKGQDPDVVDAELGCAALHMAARNGHAETARLLALRGAALQLPDRGGGLSPLHVAAHWGRGEVVDVLLGLGADARALDAVGQTPLHSAARGGHAGCVRQLLRAGADPFAADERGDTALRCAADWSYAEVVRVLRPLHVRRDAGRQWNLLQLLRVRKALPVPADVLVPVHAALWGRAEEWGAPWVG